MRFKAEVKKRSTRQEYIHRYAVIPVKIGEYWIWLEPYKFRYVEDVEIKQDLFKKVNEIRFWKEYVAKDGYKAYHCVAFNRFTCHWSSFWVIGEVRQQQKKDDKGKSSGD